MLPVLNNANADATTEDVHRNRMKVLARSTALAVCVASSVLSALIFSGNIVRSNSWCPRPMNDYTYSECDIKQDLRCLLSFILGTAFCWVLSSMTDSPEQSGKMQFPCWL